jgi:hypothetical protein
MRKSVVLFTLLAFIIGLFCGVFIITNYNNKLILATQNLVRTLSFQSAEKMAANRLENEKLLALENENTLKQNSALKISKKYNDSAGEPTLDTTDNQKNSLNFDSTLLGTELPLDTTDQSIYYQSEDEFVVKREELIATKSIKLNFIQQKKTGLDTNEQYLKSKLSIQETNETNKDILTEFWQSPLNYKGYKFNKKKLVLYGFTSFDLISIYFFNENYYLKINSIPYLLKPTEEYVSFAIVRDVELLKFLVNEN